MIKKYDIVKFNYKEFQFIVFSLDRTRLDDYIIEVGNKLRKKQFKGLVLFDLLLSNGPSDRYYTIIFNGDSFEFATIKAVLTPNKEIILISKKFYSKNFEFLNKGILSSAQKYILNKELSCELH